LTARENLHLFGRIYGVTDVAAAATRALQSVGLEAHADVLIKRYSRGMTQRLSLARAQLHQPSLLLLDEPLAGIDPDGAHEVISLFASAKERGIAAIWVTHGLERALPVVDGVWEMRRGVLSIKGESGGEVR